MNKQDFKELTEKKIVMLDGSSGVYLQKNGMPVGVCPEQWAIDNKDVLIKLQKDYIEAGSDIIYTFTFGGNPVKLEEFGLKEKTAEINRRLAEISREAAGSNALVAGDIAPTGLFPQPFGDISFEDHVDCYKEQVKGLLDGGVDLFVIETMMDIQEARAALLAVKESCDLPVIVSCTFDRDKRMLTGTDPISALITLQSIGLDAFGVNCSTGPKEMLEVIKEIKPYSKVPVLAKPNAGLPKLIDNKTVFEMEAAEFCTFAKSFVEAGVNLLGGCCGTSPEYILKTSRETQTMKPGSRETKNYSAVTSARKAVFPSIGEELILVGERINPTGKKQLQSELKDGKESEIRRFALEQTEKGAQILDVNVGTPGVNEKEAMVKTVSLLSNITDAPLCLDSPSSEVLEAALRIYPGRALINSISGEEKKIKELLPVAAKYGAMFILLPLDDKGIPDNTAERFEIVNKVFGEAQRYGYTKYDIAVDGLVMTVSSDQKAARTTLDLIKKCTDELGMNTICGLSNVSFGLPQRKYINSTFFNMAREHGLSMAIANPDMDFTISDEYAKAVLTCEDTNSEKYIEKYGGETEGVKTKQAENADDKLSVTERIYTHVVKGNREKIIDDINLALKEKMEPSKIVDDHLIPAITHVGDLFDQKKYFLPQLIQSAEAMKAAFAIVEPLLKNDAVDIKQPAKVVLATVKGDIHDIGKNIVALMLKNYGFEVIDLGKDVPKEDIIKAAKDSDADIIGLSALMTTTMIEMPKIIDMAKSEGLKARFMIGGAVITSAFAKEIGADYSRDAYEAVKTAKKLTE